MSHFILLNLRASVMSQILFKPTLRVDRVVLSNAPREGVDMRGV